MATLTLVAGPVSSTISASNAKADTVIGKYLAAYGGPVDGSNEERADWFMDHLRSHIVAVARGQKKTELLEAAEVTADDSSSDYDWAD